MQCEDEQYFYDGKEMNDLKEKEALQKTSGCSEDNSSDSSASSAMPERESWSHKIEFFIAFVGWIIGFGNVWRFPYLCYKNGGAAFLIPYGLTVMFAGAPLCLLENSLGQIMQGGCIKSWTICPVFGGIGYATVVLQVLSSIYYIVIMSWAIFFLFYSFRSPLPWITCDNFWNSVNCSSPYQVSDSETIIYGSLNSTNETDFENSTSPVREFWENNVLRISSGIDEAGGFNWGLFVSLVVAWILVFFCLWRGIKWTGKVTYVTALLPYFLLTALLIRGATLPGAVNGIKLYLLPDLKRLLDKQVWLDAIGQVMYSFGIGYGVGITFSSYNKKKNDIHKQSMLISCACSATSFYAGFVIFSMIGFMSYAEKKPIGEVAQSGPGLAFLVYPAAVAQMPLSIVWAVLFFVMLVFVGLDSQFAMIEGISGVICDNWLRQPSQNKRTLIILALCALFCLCGSVFCLGNGMYLFQLFDYYAFTGFSIAVIFISESIAIGWLLGSGRFLKLISKMIGYRPFYYWSVCWRFTTPFIGVVMLV